MEMHGIHVEMYGKYVYGIHLELHGIHMEMHETHVGGLYCAPQVPTGTSWNQADSDRNFLSRVPAK